MGKAMSRKTEKEPSVIEMIPMTPEMLQSTPRFFAERISIDLREESANITFGNLIGISESEEVKQFMIPQAFCHLTIPHLYRLRDLLIRQCERYEQEFAKNRSASQDESTD